MKIKRNVNGQEMEFELTYAEVADAHTEYDRNCTTEDIKMQCEDDYEDLTEEDFIKMTNKALHYLSKNDCYYEAYWDSVRNAIDDYMETKQNN